MGGGNDRAARNAGKPGRGGGGRYGGRGGRDGGRGGGGGRGGSGGAGMSNRGGGGGMPGVDQAALEASLGYECFREGPDRLGWLMNLSSDSIEDTVTGKIHSCVNCYFQCQDGSAFKAQVWVNDLM